VRVESVEVWGGVVTLKENTWRTQTSSPLWYGKKN